MVKVFLDEHAHCLIEELVFVDIAAACALALIMNDLRRIDVRYLPTRVLSAITPVQIFAIHKELFVQIAHRLHDFATEEHKRSAHGIDFVGSVRIEVLQIISIEDF